MRYWLVKADPDTDYSIDDLKRDGTSLWDGVHNFQAISFIKQWSVGDRVFIYHSQKEKCIVGLAEVVSAPEQNLNDTRPSWAATIKFVQKFKNPISLADIKASTENTNFLLVRNPRLSVMPVPAATLTWLQEKIS